MKGYQEQQHQQPCPSPSPNLSSSSSSLLRDISNFKTPKRTSSNLNFHSPHTQFFTSSKQTPSSSYSSASFRRRPLFAPSTVRSKTARRLKALELEQSQSSRKAQIQKEKSLKSLSKSLTVWLNFLLENPKSCGCDPSNLIGEDHVQDLGKAVSANGKRDSWPGSGVGVDRAWRSPKRQRDSSWSAANGDEWAFENSKMFSMLRCSLEEVCSFDDLKQRMRVYLNLSSCNEIFNVMTQVAKNIDEGRIKMKAHCPIVTDVGMKKKATKILLCYNPVWLRIGLYIIFGGDSLLPNGDVNPDHDLGFLKMIIEKLLFSHVGLAKAYAYNKKVEGLYRPGYFETLGNVILKRFLLLALVLDRAKSQSSLPLKHGIDGVDGGSPLLFISQSHIKSSRQVITDFLSSDVMHGEGNLLAHLVIVGYKVSYQQNPLFDYDFRVTDLFEDLQDGVRLCRAIQLLQHNSSVLMKLVVPSDAHKKNLVNCGFALQYLKQAGVPLCDEDGMMIEVEDIAHGDKELTLSLLWNMFVHLQVPLLINKAIFFEEISRVRGVDEELLNGNGSNPLQILLKWIQAVCENYDFKIDSFTSLVDGKAMWCLLDYYSRKELHCSCSYKVLQDQNEISASESIVSTINHTDAVHTFILSQKLMTLLGNFPEVLQFSDILEHNGPCNDRSVVILLVFLSSELIVKKNMDQLNFHKFLGRSCQSPEKKRSSMGRCFLCPKAALNQKESGGSNDGASYLVNEFLQCSLTGKHRINQRENAAKVIQSHFRRFIEHQNYMKIKNAISFLQIVIRAWLTVKQKSAAVNFNLIGVQAFRCESWKQSEVYGRYVMFIADRHVFVEFRRSVLLIQQAARTWIKRRHQGGNMPIQDMSLSNLADGAVILQKYRHGSTRPGVSLRDKNSFVSEENEVSDIQVEVAEKNQLGLKKNSVCNQHLAATKIQSRYRGLLLRRSLMNQTRAIITIQRKCRHLKYRRALQYKIATRSAIIIQSHVRRWFTQRVYSSLCNQRLAATKIQSHFRGWLLKKNFVKKKQATTSIQRKYRQINYWRALQNKIVTRSAIIIQSHVRRWYIQRASWRQKYLIIVIQSHCRGWLMRRHFLLQREAVIKIQTARRSQLGWKAFHCYRHAAIHIQRFVRGRITRSRLLGASCYRLATFNHSTFQSSSSCLQSFELKIVLHAVLKLQRWWKGVLCLKSKAKSAAIIQSHIRGWLARREATRERHRIVAIQSFWKGYLARKDSRGQLLNLRLRVQKSATNVDDSMRLINRLIVALSELLGMKSVSGILHTCATLDIATKHSQKCCEKLVDAGAIDTLLKLIRSVSRSIPDQEVLKHALSTLRNLARYPHLADALIDSERSIETIFWELLRNKEDGYFTASDLLKKLCTNDNGVKVVRSLPGLLKRLHSLVEDLSRKLSNEKRNVRGLAAKENTERRLREAVELLKLNAT